MCTDRARARFLTDVLAPAAETIDAQGEIPEGILEGLAETGAFGWTVSGTFGGAGLSAEEVGRRIAAVGGVCSSVRAVLTAHHMVCAAIVRWGSREIQNHWLPRLARGRTIAAFALTESRQGSQASGVQTSFTPFSGRWHVVGAKRWITSGRNAGLYLVFGRIGDKHAAVLVPAQPSGVGISRRPSPSTHGLRGAMLADIDFDVEVGNDMLLGPVSGDFSFVATHALDVGRLYVAWGAVGMTNALVARAFAHARDRTRSDQALIEHQLVQRRLSDMIAGQRAATLLCESASRMHEAALPESVLETLVCKYVAARVAREAAQSAVHIMGAEGLRQGGPAERFLRDSAVLELIEGSTEIAQIQIARNAAYVT